LSSKNGKKPDSGSSSSSSFFTWFIVLALLGVWTSVAVVYFDLVDYQGMICLHLLPVLLLPSEKMHVKNHQTEDVGLKLREALKQQLTIIHERVEAKKMAKLALAEVRQLLAKEEEEKELDLGRKEITARVKERVASRLKEEEEKMEKEEIEKALEKVRQEKVKQNGEEKEEETKDKGGEKKSKKREEKVNLEVSGHGVTK
uniref:Aspartyl beta-hydroxylase/Triadin domain-containing protein n=1 Tax=Xiphophorus couchianus TaxID=32473 RepID=A0A3B5LIH6_9TELE